jgi:hypothetical protein
VENLIDVFPNYGVKLEAGGLTAIFMNLERHDPLQTEERASEGAGTGTQSGNDF